MNTNITNIRDGSRTQRAQISRTPYHALGDDAQMVVPDWAQHRSVYRSSGRTLYVIDTDRLADARTDLARLERAGWDVTIEQLAEPGRARVALMRRDFARAA